MKIISSSFVQKFNEQPAMLSPQAFQHLEHLIRDSERPQGEVPFDEMCAAAYGFPVTDRDKPFVFSNGIAFIPVYGVLLHKYNYSWEGATGYDYIRARFDAAIGDSQVKGIVFDVNSPGGQVAGNFELSDHIYKNRKAKPMIALVDAMAASGGYSLASSTGRIVATPSAIAGSIGVVMMHVSVKRAFEDFGIDINLIYAGKHKVDGSPYKELSDDARQRFQASVDRSYDQFVSLVSRNRGLEADDVRATEALTYDASEAKRVGLVDAVQEPVAALAAFRKELSGSSQTFGGTAMSDASKPEANSNASTDTPSSKENNVTTVNERERISTILGCDEAKNRQALAKHIAFNTDMAADDAKAMLSASAEEPTEKSNGFMKAMDEGKHPDMDAGDGNDKGGAEASVGDRISKTYASFHGIKNH